MMAKGLIHYEAFKETLSGLTRRQLAAGQGPKSFIRSGDPKSQPDACWRSAASFSCNLNMSVELLQSRLLLQVRDLSWVDGWVQPSLQKKPYMELIWRER